VRYWKSIAFSSHTICLKSEAESGLCTTRAPSQQRMPKLGEAASVQGLFVGHDFRDLVLLLALTSPAGPHFYSLSTLRQASGDDGVWTLASPVEIPVAEPILLQLWCLYGMV